MQLYLVYFGASFFGIRSRRLEPRRRSGSPSTRARLLGEIWRGCIQAIPAASGKVRRPSPSDTPPQLRYVILPQALRIAIPPTVGFLVQILKGTSLASIIGFTELTRAAQIVNNATFRPFIVYATVTLLYFALLLAAVPAEPAAQSTAGPPSAGRWSLPRHEPHEALSHRVRLSGTGSSIETRVRAPCGAR